MGEFDGIEPKFVSVSDTFVGNEKLTVLCGANRRKLSDMVGYTVTDVRKNMREVLNIGDDHTIVLVNGKQISNEDIILNGSEEVEFKKPSGTKG